MRLDKAHRNTLLKRGLHCSIYYFVLCCCMMMKKDKYRHQFLLFLRENKKWWLLPIVLVLGMISLLVILGGSGMAPFIYTIF